MGAIGGLDPETTCRRFSWRRRRTAAAPQTARSSAGPGGESSRSPRTVEHRQSSWWAGPSVGSDVSATAGPGQPRDPTGVPVGQDPTGCTQARGGRYSAPRRLPGEVLIQMDAGHGARLEAARRTWPCSGRARAGVLNGVSG